jgi:hypothetical protein
MWQLSPGRQTRLTPQMAISGVSFSISITASGDEAFSAFLRPEQVAPRRPVSRVPRMFCRRLSGCPGITWMMQISTPLSGREVAKLCRSLCALSFLVSRAALVAGLQAE